jgi:hypothetical protein
MGVIVQVRSCLDRRAGGWPVRFEIGSCEFMIEEVIDHWYGSEVTFYKVRADDGNLYVLKRRRAVDEWSLESFRRLL